nr:hypothetical protein [Tanacetum cinerariifolium]
GFQPGRQVAGNAREYPLAAPGVKAVAAADVFVEQAFADEFAQRPLWQRRGVPVGQLLGFDDGF